MADEYFTVCGWMGWWVGEWADVCVDGLVGGWVNGRMCVWMDGLVGG